MKYIAIGILCIYYASALVLRASYNETILMYYSILFYPLATGIFLWMSKDSKTWKQALLTGAMFGAIFGLFAGVSEIIIFHLMEGMLTERFGLVVGDFIDGFNYRFITIPLLRVVMYTVIGSVVTIAGFGISRMKSKTSKN